MFFLFWSIERASQLAESEPEQSMNGIHDSIALIVVSDLLCLWFIIDLALRITSEGWAFLQGNLVWHFFDFFVVLVYIMEIISNHCFIHQRSYSHFRIVISHLSML